MSFTDADLKRWKEYLAQTPEAMRKLPMVKDELALLARLEAAEQVVIDIAFPDHGFFDEMGFRKTHYDAWRKSKGIDTESLKEWDLKQQRKAGK